MVKRAKSISGARTRLQPWCFALSTPPCSPYLCLHHGRSLCSQHLYCLENIYNPLVAHPFQDDAQGDEHSGPAHASTAGIGGGEKETLCYGVQMFS